MSVKLEFLDFRPKSSELKFIHFHPRYPAITPKPITLLDKVETINYLEWFFVSGIKVQRNDGSESILKTTSLFEQFLSVANQRIAPGSLASNKKLHQLFLEAIHPIDGGLITEKDLEKLFDDLRSSKFLNALKEDQRKAVKSSIEEHLENFKIRHLQSLPFDVESMKANLKPGDLFCYQKRSKIPGIIIKGQTIQHIFTPSLKERQAHRFSHLAIYLGGGQVAEASTSAEGMNVRIVSLDDPRFALEGKGVYYITRYRDESIAKEAADVARKVARLAPPVGECKCPTPHRYAYFQAARAVLPWHPSNFGPFGRYRYLKQYIDDRRGEIPKDFFKNKDFYCSYFAGYCYQTAESRRVMPAILGKDDAPLTGITPVGKGIFRDLWARIRRIANWSAMSEAVKLQFDAKRLTPFDFRQFIVRNPDLFKDVFVIQRAAL